MHVKIAFTPLGVKTVKLRTFASAKFAVNDFLEKTFKKYDVTSRVFLKRKS